ncbi:MAG TPA: hypothetical protein VH061_09125 [Solirubrobacteraceae bacterium]|jgi:uncharacterized membrane protein YadS|nr:hypothetical protein [Solirubrobacteraceae bacterium]
MNGRGIHRGGTFLLSIAMVAIGVVVIVQSLSDSAGPLSARLLLGILFLAAGAGRLYVEIRRGREL